jgi:hypothetical protein
MVLVNEIEACSLTVTMRLFQLILIPVCISHTSSLAISHVWGQTEWCWVQRVRGKSIGLQGKSQIHGRGPSAFSAFEAGDANADIGLWKELTQTGT